MLTLFTDQSSMLSRLDALDEFIQAQKTLLEKTQSDIKRLRELRAQAAHDIGDFVETLSERVGHLRDCDRLANS